MEESCDGLQVSGEGGRLEGEVITTTSSTTSSVRGVFENGMVSRWTKTAMATSESTSWMVRTARVASFHVARDGMARTTRNGADGRALHGRIIVVVMRLRRDGKEIFQRFI